MKATLTLAGLVLCLLPSAVLAAPPHKAIPAKKATQAKTDHYKDPTDGGKLVAVTPKKH